MKTIQLLIFSLLLPTLLLATADGPDFWQVQKVRSDDVLNIRIKPDWRSEKIGEIPHDGICLQNLGCVGGLNMQEFTELSKVEQKKILRKRPRWCKIKYQGTMGWVSGKYIKEGESTYCNK